MKRDTLKSNIFTHKICLSAISLILFLAVTEGALRLTAHFNKKQTDALLSEMGGPHEKDYLLFWKLRPSEKNGVNSRGYRGLEKNVKKPDGVYRIIVLGDSCAYGMWVGWKETYSFLLEEKLNHDRSRKYEVINAGVPGYSSYQGKMYFKNRLLEYHPDMIIIGFGFNDLSDAIKFKDSEIPLRTSSMITADNILNKFMFYRYFKKLVYFARFKLKAPEQRLCAESDAEFDKIENLPALVDAQEKKLLLYSKLKRVPPRDFYDNIIEMIRAAESKNIKVALLTLPSLNGSFGYARLVRLMAKERDVMLIDLIEEFEKRNANKRGYFIDYNHYNPKGHGLIADILREKLLLN